ncbi:MAG TPA: hypothetical protein VIG50_19180 [Vicinamibacteria bacterium]|jgi:hypothetical protein
MITVCAWCQRMIAADAPDRLLISHGMCSGCQTAATAREPRSPIVVVPVRHANLLPALQTLLRESGIAVLLDRRVGERRRSSDSAPGEERRQRPDRRAGPPTMVC